MAGPARGKLRPPRLGLLAYLVEAFRTAKAPTGEVHLVPVAIVYDQLYEVRTHGGRGARRREAPEGIGWALGYARAQGEGLGAVHVRFGEPLALAAGLAASGGSVEKLAFEVCHRISRATPLTANALVSLALLGVEDRALTVEEARAVLAPLLDYLERRGLEVAGGVDLSTGAGVRATLDALTGHGVLHRDGTSGNGAEPRWSVARHLEAAFYRNAGIHFFVNRAIVEMVALRVADQGADVSGAPLETAWAEAVHLRDLLKFEFFFARQARVRRRAGRGAETSSTRSGRRSATIAGTVWKGLTGSADAPGPPGAAGVPGGVRWWWPSVLVESGPRSRGTRRSSWRRAWRRRASGSVRDGWHSPESASKELFPNALELAVNGDLGRHWRPWRDRPGRAAGGIRRRGRRRRWPGWSAVREAASAAMLVGSGVS